MTPSRDSLTLVDIGYGRGRLAPDAAASLARIDAVMFDAWARRLDVNEAWRSPEQADKNYAAYLRSLNGGPWAPIAFPASQSVHCLGEAIDTDDWALVWLLNDHGWYQTVFRDGKLAERWHFEYFPDRDNHRYETGTPAGEQDDEMSAAGEARIIALGEHIEQLLMVPNTNYGWPQHAYNAVVDGRGVLDTVALRLRGFDPKNDMLQRILERLGAPVDTTVDIAALARELAPLLERAMDDLTDDEVERIATATADERDRRERARLK